MDSMTASALSGMQRKARGGRTGDILFQDIELLENRAQKLLGVFINDQDLPFASGVHGSDSVKEF